MPMVPLRAAGPKAVTEPKVSHFIASFSESNFLRGIRSGNVDRLFFYCIFCLWVTRTPRVFLEVISGNLFTQFPVQQQ